MFFYPSKLLKITFSPLLSQCIDGKKTIPPQCQWSGLAVLEPKKPPQLLKLRVAAKYCTAAGFDRPEDEVIDCEE